MSRVRIKICGVTAPQDAVACAAHGVDAIGLVFADGSPRRVELPAAAAIAAAAGPFITTVALFRDNEPELIEAVLDKLRPTLLQFHGRETREECERYGWPYLKALPMGSGKPFNELAAPFETACGLLVDAHGEDEAGGSGKCFNWAQIPANCTQPIILAGGLRPTNVAEAIRLVRPYAVDVSSGVESSPGRKDHALIRKFVEEVHHHGS